MSHEYVFVPVARDGSIFAPRLRRGSVGIGGYTIGPKGAERVVHEFAEALTELCQMEIPRWRRPNARDNWGIVTGIAWRRVRRDELEGFAI
jgi:hypothetical protein